MTKVTFNCDPLSLVRLALNRYIEELEGNDTKSVQFARYDYLISLTDEELEQLLERYVKEENIEVITLEDWKKDSSFLLKYIYETNEYKELKLKYDKQGCGVTGLGVFDKSKNTFYDCSLARHWQTIMEIIEYHYTHLHEAFLQMYGDNELNEYDGITRQEIETFIMNNFELVGGSRQISGYMN